MTELQDEICDRLVGATVEPRSAGGPLHVAALVVGPGFALARDPAGYVDRLAVVLGWPVLLCYGVTGANAALGAEADRRSLAITAFARVPTGQSGPASVAACRAVAGWAYLRAHESACGTGCPLHPAAAAAIGAAAAGEAWVNPFRAGLDCRTAPAQNRTPVTRRSSAAQHAAVGLRYLFTALAAGRVRASWPYAVREASKAEAKAGGVDAAADFCLRLAKRIGMRGDWPAGEGAP